MSVEAVAPRPFAAFVLSALLLVGCATTSAPTDATGDPNVTAAATTTATAEPSVAATETASPSEPATEGACISPELAAVLDELADENPEVVDDAIDGLESLELEGSAADGRDRLVERLSGSDPFAFDPGPTEELILLFRMELPDC